MKNYKIGKVINGYYIPYPLDKSDLESDKWSFSDMETIKLMNRASNLLGELNGLADATPNLSNYINMFTLSEATAKSSMDGSNFSFDEFLYPESHIGTYSNRIDDWRIGLNLAKILKEIAKNRYEELDEDSLCEMHFELLKDAGRKSIDGGDYRISEVAMPEMNANACPPDNLDYEIYNVLGAEDSDGLNELPGLAKTALMAMIFESIQPFEIESDTMTRLLITKWLMQYGLLEHPILPVFRWFNENDDDWQSALEEARSRNDAEFWVQTFMEFVCSMAYLGINMLKKARATEVAINEKMKLLDAKKLAKAQLIMPELWEKGCISINRTMELTETSFPTASKLLLEMEEQGIVEEWTGGTRNKEYGITGYVQMFLVFHS